MWSCTDNKTKFLTKSNKTPNPKKTWKSETTLTLRYKPLWKEVKFMYEMQLIG